MNAHDRLRQATAVILRNEEVKGTAWLFSCNRLLTAGHVIARAGAKIGDSLYICFASHIDNKKEYKQMAKVVDLLYSDKERIDFAVLELHDDVAHVPLDISYGAVVGQCDYMCYAYNKNKGEVEYMSECKSNGVVSFDGMDMIQLHSSSLTYGSSGAAIVDASTGKAVGLVVAGARDDPTVSYALLLDRIKEHLPIAETKKGCTNAAL